MPLVHDARRRRIRQSGMSDSEAAVLNRQWRRCGARQPRGFPLHGERVISDIGMVYCQYQGKGHEWWNARRILFIERLMVDFHLGLALARLVNLELFASGYIVMVNGNDLHCDCVHRVCDLHARTHVSRYRKLHEHHARQRKQCRHDTRFTG